MPSDTALFSENDVTALKPQQMAEPPAPTPLACEDAAAAPNVPWKVIRDQAAMAAELNPKYNLDKMLGLKEMVKKSEIVKKLKEMRLSVEPVMNLDVYDVGSLTRFSKLEVVHVLEVPVPPPARVHEKIRLTAPLSRTRSVLPFAPPSTSMRARCLVLSLARFGAPFKQRPFVARARAKN
jgi:hypothetical protein